VIPGLPDVYDEPFGGASQIPTYLVAKLAREHVTVALSGDGGDELFGGYNRHFWGRNIYRRTGWMPSPLRGVAAAALRGPSPGSWDRIYALASPIAPQG
jgi:asparagine synthase (glutamine-hydrolysing)